MLPKTDAAKRLAPDESDDKRKRRLHSSPISYGQKKSKLARKKNNINRNRDDGGDGKNNNKNTSGNSSVQNISNRSTPQLPKIVLQMSEIFGLAGIF
jgi:hypothetical protein